MKQHRQQHELIEQFTLLEKETELVQSKPHQTQLGFAVLLKYFQYHHQFPKCAEDIPKVVLRYIAQQVNLPAETFQEYSWEGKTIKNHRAEIRSFFDFRPGTKEDMKEISQWLKSKVLDHLLNDEALKEEVYQEYDRRKIERTTDSYIDVIVRSAIRSFETGFYEKTYRKLSSLTLSSMDALMKSYIEMENEESGDEKEEKERITFRKLTLEPGAVNKDNLFLELKKLKTLYLLELPDNLFYHIPPKVLQRYRLRAVSEEKRELLRHQPATRYTLLAALFWMKTKEITDSLIDSLITLIHKIDGRAEKKVKKEILIEVQKVRGKNDILILLLETALENPSGIIEETLLSLVDPSTLKNIIKELKYNKTIYQKKVYYKIGSEPAIERRTVICPNIGKCTDSKTACGHECFILLSRG